MSYYGATHRVTVLFTIACNSATSHQNTLHRVMSCQPIPRRIMTNPKNAVALCHVIIRQVTEPEFITANMLSCHVVSCRVMSCHVVSCRVMSCHAVSCPVKSGRVSGMATATATPRHATPRHAAQSEHHDNVISHIACNVMNFSEHIHNRDVPARHLCTCSRLNLQAEAYENVRRVQKARHRCSLGSRRCQQTCSSCGRSHRRRSRGS